MLNIECTTEDVNKDEHNVQNGTITMMIITIYLGESNVCGVDAYSMFPGWMCLRV